jgi:hypothetical protein
MRVQFSASKHIVHSTVILSVTTASPVPARGSRAGDGSNRTPPASLPNAIFCPLTAHGNEMAEAEAPLEVTPELAGEPFSRETTRIRPVGRKTLRRQSFAIDASVLSLHLNARDVPRPLEANSEANVS